jgi:integrase
LAPLTQRDRVLTDDEVAAVWRATEGGGAFSGIVRMLILTGQRREEVGGMTWDELSEGLATWTIPASRAKNGIAHIVPLSEPVRELLQNITPSDDLLFAGLRGVFKGWSKAKTALDARSGVTGWRLHDLRRTMATGLQRLGVRLEVTEQILNHVAGSRAGIVGVYQRHDFASEKRTALEAWGEHVMAVVAGREPTNNPHESEKCEISRTTLSAKK